MAIFSLVMLVMLFVLCFGAPFIAPYPKNDQNLLLADQSPSAQHSWAPTTWAATS